VRSQPVTSKTSCTSIVASTSCSGQSIASPPKRRAVALDAPHAQQIRSEHTRRMTKT